MSISTFNKLLQNQGCVWFVSAVTLAGVIGGFLYQGCAAEIGKHQPAETEKTNDVVARVGDVTITETVINTRAEDQIREQFHGAITMDKLPPSYVLQQVGSSLAGLVTNAQLAYLGKKQGLKPTDDEVVRLAQDALKQRVEEARQQLIMAKKLKPTATQKEFDDIIKQQGGKTVAEIMQGQEKDVRDALKDPARRENVLASIYYPQAMFEAEKKKFKVTDDELKKTFTIYDFKRIFFAHGAGGTTVEPMDQAKKVYNEIKGGLSFDDAINKYSGDRPEAKKKLSERITPVKYEDLMKVPDYKPLLSLKPGDVSEPIQMGPGAALYKLIDIKPNLPKDFDKRKDFYRDQYVTGQASAVVQQQLDQGIPIQWVDRTYQVMYEANKMTGQPLDDATRRKKTLDLIQIAEDAASNQNAQRGRMAASLALNLYKGLASMSTPDEKKALLDKGIEVYNLFFRNDEDAAARMELTDIYIEKGKGAEAAAQLYSAALANQFNADAQGQSTFNNINSKLKILRDKKMASEEDLKKVDELQQAFAKNKQEEDKRAAEQKKLDDAAKKEADKASKKPGPTAPPATSTTKPSGEKPADKPADKPGKTKGK